QYSYNADHQLTQILRPGGDTVSMAYDTAGRPTSLTVAQGAYTYAYDPTTGQLASVSAPAGSTVSYGYDGALRTSESWSGPVNESVAYAYNDDFLVQSWQVGNEPAVAYAYNADLQLVQAGEMAYTYAPASGYLESATLDGVASAWQYTPFGEMSTYAVTFQTDELYDLALTRDVAGRVVTKTETVAGVTAVYGYAYDVAGRLVAVSQDGAVVENYAYDANGNRVLAGEDTAVYDAQDRLRQRGNHTYTYNASGDLTSHTEAGQTTTYDYDSLSNLLAVTLPTGDEITYIVDGHNRRVGKRVNGVLTQAFLYQGQLNPLAELDGSGAVVSLFVYGSRGNVPDYMVKHGRVYHFVTDHLGSVQLVVDAETGDIAQQLSYSAWGVVTQDTNPGFQPFGFAGGLYDTDTGLVRFGARDYDAASGRWTSKDPLGFAGGDANLYAYVLNNPVNLIDSNG
ncbi:MAG: hypothetical protein KDD89_15125, partial [Anaerolineales bacterium]|nr:hypothetical protein [Anaerolineales bacterium]